jgi:hypothetical protein
MTKVALAIGSFGDHCRTGRWSPAVAGRPRSFRIIGTIWKSRRSGTGGADSDFAHQQGALTAHTNKERPDPAHRVRHSAGSVYATLRPMAPLEDQARRLEAAAAALLDLGLRIEAGAPWPLSAVFGAEPEASWGPAELLAHVGEFLPYWLGEIERVLAGPPGAPVPFGRVQTDGVRIGVIGRDRTLPVRELLARIDADSKRVAGRLRELDDAEASRVGRHPARGEMQVRDMLEPFLSGHVEGHVTQLREILATAGA